MPDEAKYRVGMVSKMTGLSTHTLRVWERRYDAVTPQRTEAGGRLYTDKDVERLRLLHRLVGDGHSIGGIAALPDAELHQMVATLPTATVQTGSEQLDALRARYIEAIERLQIGEAEQMLSRVALGTEPGEFLRSVVGPILEEVGNRWERGELRIAHEHASSTVMRGLLFSLMRLYPAHASMPCAIVATPADEHHELGALMVAMLATMYGWRVLYLGADLPAEEIAYAVENTDAELVMLSISNLSPEASRRELGAVDRALPEGVRLLVGGRAAALPSRTRAELHENLSSLESVLSR